MTYPLSSEVMAGQATEASQYNNLRADALYLGGDPSSAAPLRDLFMENISGIRLSRTGKLQITLSASEDEPAAVVIHGVPYAVYSGITLNIDASTLPASGRGNIYAVGGTGGGFTLSLSSASAQSRRIGSFVCTAEGIVPGTVKNLTEEEKADRDDSIACGRLTLVGGDPVPDADVTASSTVYYTPYLGNRISLFLGGQWEMFTFSEMSLALGSLGRDLPHDIFMGADDDGLFLTAISWGSKTSRASGALQRLDGVMVSGSDTGLRYLGTVAVNASGVCQDAKNARMIWNENNRMARPLLSKLGDAGTGVQHNGYWSPYYGNNAPEVMLLVPSNETDFTLEALGAHTQITEDNVSSARFYALGIGQDMAKSAPFTTNVSCVPVFTRSFGNAPLSVSIRNYGSAFQGLHTYTMCARSNYTYYDDGTVFRGSIGECPGMTGYIMA